MSVAALLTLSEATAAVLARSRPLAAEHVRVGAGGRPRARRDGRRTRRPAAVSRVRHGRLRAARGGHAGQRWPSCSDRRRPAGDAAARGRARRWASRPAASCPRAPTPSCRSRTSTERDTGRDSGRRRHGRATSVRSRRRRRAGRRARRGRQPARRRRSIAALAAAGVATRRCARRPRVAVLTTGTELRRRR